MFPKTTKTTKWKIAQNGWGAIKNHQKYFTNSSCISRWWGLLSILLLHVGAYLIYLGLPKKFEFSLIQINGFLIICGGIAILIFLAFQQKKNLKGIMLDVETDLTPDIHYVVESILGETSAETICRLAVEYPATKTLSPWTGAWKIKQMAKEHGINFATGIVFGIRKDGTFFFVHPPESQREEKKE